MKLPEKFIDKYFLEQYLIANWGSILGLLREYRIDHGSDIDAQILEELKKCNLKYITLVEKEDKEDDEE